MKWQININGDLPPQIKKKSKIAEVIDDMIEPVK